MGRSRRTRTVGESMLGVVEDVDENVAAVSLGDGGREARTGGREEKVNRCRAWKDDM